MSSGATVHILWQGATLCGFWWGNAPAGDVWVAPWEWEKLKDINHDLDVKPFDLRAMPIQECTKCAEAFAKSDSNWRKQWEGILG